jgi:NAD+ synthetase
MKTINYKETLKKLRTELHNYLIDNKLKSIVIGVSGGIDSALVCAIAYPVAKELGVNLIGRSISIVTNKKDERERAINIGKYFCTNFDEVDLSEEFETIENIVSRDHHDNLTGSETERETKIRLGNVKARMRMIYLYDLAQKNRGMVMSTDNFTELMVAFFTLHGDVGDYGLIQELWKTEVYGLTEWIAKNEVTGEASNALLSMLDAVATDGLGITNSDLDQLLPDWKERHNTTREGYKEVDEILEEYLFTIGQEIKRPSFEEYSRAAERRKILQNHPVIDRHIRTEFKRNNPINIKREKFIIYE